MTARELTFRQQVLQVCPQACLRLEGVHESMYRVYSRRSGGALLGWAEKSNDAWADAAKRLNEGAGK